MGLEEELTDAMIQLYYDAGEATGYWGRRYLMAVRRNGGLATAKRMLTPRTKAQRAGLDALLEANRPDLSVEAVMQQERFAELFTREELSEARRRVGDLMEAADEVARTRERLYPDELEPGRKYVEGARKQVRVNAYEHSTAARRACLKVHGYRCQVCDIEFGERYGAIGEGFIHVHHKRPLALTDGAYELDAVKDLVPVCPNCHAMLHRSETVLTVDDLRSRLGGAGE